MRKQLTTVQQNKRNRIIKRIIYSIILAIAIPCVYLYCSNYIEDYFYDLNSDILLSLSKSSNKKQIVQQSNIADLNETNAENIKDTQNANSDTEKYVNNINDDNTNTDTYISTDNNNISSFDRFSSYEPTLPTDDIDSSNSLDTKKDSSTDININSETNKQNDTGISPEALEEIKRNNEQIAQYQNQIEELNAIKEKYNAKVSAIETWYNNEFNKNYDLMIEHKNEYEELGGYATTEDKVKALKKIKSSGVEMLNAGLISAGQTSSYTEALKKEYELVCKRWAYSQKYDEYYEYIYTTLPANKTSKLSIAVQEYNEDLKNYKEKYGV